MITNRFVNERVNKPIDSRLDHFTSSHNPPFLVEEKHDGERVLLEVSDKIMIANKHKTVYPENVLPKPLLKGIKKLKKGIYDAEFYSLKGNLYKFLSARAKLSRDLALAIFDILDIDNPLSYRKFLLSKNVKSTEHIHTVNYDICHTEKQIRKSFASFVSKGFEGVVVKPDSNYNDDWLKIKEQYTSDFVVLAVKKTSSWKKDRIPYTFLIGVYDNSKFRPVGNVSSGLKIAEKQAIGNFVEELKTRENNEYIYIKPEIVLEVSYHQKTKNSLREPKINCIRFDKNPKECDKLEIRNNMNLLS